MNHRIRIGAIRSKLTRCSEKIWNQYINNEIIWEKGFTDKFYIDIPITRSESPGKPLILNRKNNPYVCGYYKPMESKAELYLFPSGACRFALKHFDNYLKTLNSEYALKAKEHKYFVSWLQILLELTMIHLSFHHACDVTQHISPYFRNPGIEEPLTLAFAISQLKMEKFLSVLPEAIKKSTQKYLFKIIQNPGNFIEPYSTFPDYLNKNRDFIVEKFEDYIAWNYPKKSIKRELLSRLFMQSLCLYSVVIIDCEDQIDFGE